MACAAGAITCVEVASSGSSTQASVPVTFGQPFKAGDLLSTQGLVATDNKGAAVPLQMDEVSSHQDGSVRFAVLSAKVSGLAANEKRVINLFTGAKTGSTPVVPADPAWNLEVELNMSDGTTLIAQPQAQLKAQIASGAGKRLSGPVAAEYTVVTSFKNKATNAVHPHLVARLHTRLYEDGARIRTDAVIENNRTFVAGPSNVTYSMAIKQNGQTVFTQPQFTHNHHARWHKVVWTGTQPQYSLRHHLPYFMASKITWNYDLSLKVPESVLASDASSLANANTAPMGPAYILPYFPTTGGRRDIGPLPRWAALFLVTQDSRARASMMANADASAGIPVHYRDETDPNNQPLSIDRHPEVTLRYDSSIPAVPKGSGSTIWEPDQSHQPSFAYIPYLITGDAFYQDEMMFWANWNLTYAPPGDIYRNYAAGLVKWEQVRGQGWILRSLGEAAFALPDAHPRKTYFNTLLTNNMNWYEQKFVNNPSYSPLGAVPGSDDSETGPWQNDFVGIVFSFLAENKVPKAQAILNRFSNFNVGRYTNDANGFCAAKGPGYYWQIKDSGGSFISSWSALYARNYAGDVGKACTSVSIEGYPNEAVGASAYSRAMLGAAANAGVSGASAAYTKWKGMTPNMDAAFTSDPTWAIVPR